MERGRKGPERNARSKNRSTHANIHNNTKKRNESVVVASKSRKISVDEILIGEERKSLRRELSNWDRAVFGLLEEGN